MLRVKTPPTAIAERVDQVQPHMKWASTMFSSPLPVFDIDRHLWESRKRRGEDPRRQSKTNWHEEFTAEAVNDWMREGFGI